MVSWLKLFLLSGVCLAWSEDRLANGMCRYGNRVACCWGWTQETWGRCRPMCELGCKHGKCVGPDQCHCHAGYTGKTCNQDLNECGLKPRPCLDRCMNTLGSYKCYCLHGYMTMRDGTCRNARTCAMTNCQYGCAVMKGEVVCQCPSPGLRLAPDRRTCVDIDECVTGDARCPRFRKCVNTFGSYICRCHRGFELHYVNGKYQCTDKNDFSICRDKPGSKNCKCKTATYGKGYDCKPLIKVTIQPARPATTSRPTTKITTATTTRTSTPPTITASAKRPVMTTTSTMIITATITSPTTMATSTSPPSTTPTTVAPTTPTTADPTTPNTADPTSPTTVAPTTPTTVAPTTTAIADPTTPTTVAPATPTTADPTTPTTVAPATPTTADPTTPTTGAPTTPTTADPTTPTTVAPTTPNTGATTFTSTVTTTTPTTVATRHPTSVATTLPTIVPTTHTLTHTTLGLFTLTTKNTTTTTTPRPVSTTTITMTTATLATTAAPPSSSAPSIDPLITSTLDNRIQDITHRPRGDVHIPRNTGENSLFDLDFDIELGNTEGYARDDPGAGSLSCSFDHGVCSWMTDGEGDLHWEAVDDPAGGRYLIVPEATTGPSVKGARLTIPLAPPLIRIWQGGDLCLSFRHLLSGHHTGSLQVFVRKGQSHSPAIWTRTGGQGWRNTQITAWGRGLESVVLKGERRKGGKIAVDDFRLQRGACRDSGRE
ncbi:nephronectin [Electrophorus electricus]|uniref:nephronectin n=1 Tax=Electrophorus electricus TaxID=8005 RepID=UPI0015D0484C|nr:nephronectin [Electrophorus electricus]